VIWLVALLVSRRAAQLPQQMIIPVGAWLGLLLASTANAPGDQSLPLHFTARMATGVLVGMITYDLVQFSQRWLCIARCLAIGGFLVAILGMAEAFGIPYVTSWLNNFKFAPTRVGDILRISSTLSYATITAMVLEMTFPLVLAWFLSTKKLLMKVLLAFVGVTYLVVLVLTLSRAGLLAICAALAVVFAAAALKHEIGVALTAMAVIGIVGGLALVSLINNPDLNLRLTSENDASWYKAGLVTTDTVYAAPGQTVIVQVTLSNVGVKVWNDNAVHSFAVSYHLFKSDGSILTYDGTRTHLSERVMPGQTVTVNAAVTAPGYPGSFAIQWDVVQDSVTWFSWKGSVVKVAKLIVTGAPAATQNFGQTPLPQASLSTPVPGRFQLWQAAIAMVRDYPMLGIGPDNFRWMYGPYSSNARWNTDIHANNLYLEFLADTGVLGLVTFMWFVWRITTLATQGLLTNHRDSSWIWRVALLASLSAWFVHGLLDYFFEFTPTYVAFWIIAGLTVGLATLDIDREANRPTYAHRI
jgi:hypothetical protein